MTPEELAAIKAEYAQVQANTSIDPFLIGILGSRWCRVALHVPTLVAEIKRLQRELDAAEDDRAAAYLREAQLWDLLGRARGFLPDSVLADPESPIPDMELRQLRHDLAVQLEADPPEAGRKLWEELQRLRKRLAELDDTPHHVIEFREDGWTLKHPLSCRPHLFDCPVNQACQGFDGPPAAIGRYVVDLDGDGELRIGEEVRADG